MFKLINLLWFIGSLAKGVAKMLVHSAPAFKELKDANAKNQLIAQLKNEIEHETTAKNVPSGDNRNTTDGN